MPPDTAPHPTPSRERSPPVAQDSPLPPGAVLDGRWRIGEQLAGKPGRYAVHHAADLRLQRRPVLALVVPDNDVPTDGMHLPGAALSILDVAAVPEGKAILLARPLGAAPLADAVTLSREDRATLLSQLHATFGEDPDHRLVLGDPNLLLHAHIAGGPRLLVLPVMADDPEREAVERQAGLIALVRTTLFGLDEALDTEATLARLPAAIADLVEDPGSHTDASAVARALGAHPASASVPLRPTPDERPLPTVLDPWNLSRRNERRRTATQLAILISAIALLALHFRDLLAEPAVPPGLHDLPRAAPASGSRTPPPPTQRSALPSARSEAPAPEQQQLPLARATLYRLAHFGGPEPVLIAPFESRFPPLHAHVRTFGPDGGPVERLEWFEEGGRFSGFTTLRRDAGGAIRERVDHDPYGRVRLRIARAAEDDRLVMRDGQGGAPAGPCRIEPTGDDAGYSSLACLDESANPGTFPTTRTHRVRFVHDHPGPGVAVRRVAEDTDLRPAALFGEAVADRRVRDREGRLVLHGTEDQDGTPQPAFEGLPATWHFAHDADVRITHATAADGTAAPLATAVYRVVEHLDIRGAVREIHLQGAANEPVHAPGTTVARIILERDSRGHVTERIHIDRHGRPGATADGVHRIRLTPGPLGTPLRECHDGIDGPIASDLLDGAHCIVHQQDAAGRLVHRRAHGIHNEPALLAAVGTHGEERRFDASGRVVELLTLDADGRQAVSHAGVHATRYGWTDAGQLERVQFLDARGHRAENRFGVAGFAREQTTDSAGQAVDLLCAFDERWRRAPLLGGFGRGATCVTRRHDARGVREIAWTDARGAPVLVELGDPWLQASRVVFERDAAGRAVRQTLLDTDGTTVLAQRDCTHAGACVSGSGLSRGAEHDPPDHWPDPHWRHDPGGADATDGLSDLGIPMGPPVPRWLHALSER